MKEGLWPILLLLLQALVLLRPSHGKGVLVRIPAAEGVRREAPANKGGRKNPMTRNKWRDLFSSDDGAMDSGVNEMWAAAQSAEKGVNHLFLVECLAGPDPSCVTGIENATESRHVFPVGKSGFYSAALHGQQAKLLEDLEWIGSVTPFTPDLKIDGALWDKLERSVYAASERVELAVALELTREELWRPMLERWEASMKTMGIEVDMLDRRIHDKRESRALPPVPTERRRSVMAVRNVSADNVSTVVQWLARLPAVHWIEERPHYERSNEWAAGVVQGGIQKEDLVWDSGLTATDQIFGISDTGVDLTSCYFHDPSCNPFDVATADLNCRKVVSYTCYVDCLDYYEGHGTHVCGSAVGASSSSFSTSWEAFDGGGKGGKLAFMDVGDEDGALSIPADLHTDLLSVLYDFGARVHSASWGSTSNTYTTDARAVDSFLFDNEDALMLLAAGNYGQDGFSSVGSPATSKNGVAVGASLNAAEMWVEQDLAVDPQDYNQYAVAYFSSKGPTSDGRLKPDIVAPGYYIWSALSQGYDSKEEHCGVVGLAGTSMATPTAAAEAALVREYFQRGFYPSGMETPADAFTPSGALIKAMLINSGVEMSHLLQEDGTKADVDFPGTVQGYGLLSLGQVLYLDEGVATSSSASASAKRSGGCSSLSVFGDTDRGSDLHASLASTGDVDTFSFNVTRTSDTTTTTTTAEVDNIEIVVTLVWTDPPGTVGARKVLVNDLDMAITNEATGEVLYPHTATAEHPDQVNTVEQITIQSPGNGSFTVTVTAASLSTAQPYALVLTGAHHIEKESILSAVSGAWDTWDSWGWLGVYLAVFCLVLVSVWKATAAGKEVWVCPAQRPVRKPPEAHSRWEWFSRTPLLHDSAES